MNIYFIGMVISMALYIIIGGMVSRKLKSANDFYIAEGNAPTILIVGSIVASYIGCGVYMGDAGECYAGYYAALLTIITMKVVGPIYGSVFFGRYLRRSGCTTLPEYYGVRFHSTAVRKLSAVIAIISMVVYLLSVTQGLGTLMSFVTGAPYIICIVLVMITFTLISALSGSKGVLLTDTIMFAVFSSASIVGLGFIVKAAGGWFPSIEALANFDKVPGLLAWTCNLDYMYPTGIQNFIWACGYGIVWGAIASIAPWQSSRYLMAKNESVCIRSGAYAAIFLFLIEFVVNISGVFINRINPDIQDQSHAVLWTVMNRMPTIIGVVFLTGMLAAGISSSTTFLSLIGSFFTVDILGKKDKSDGLFWARVAIVAASAVVFILAYANPPSLFWIMYLGATLVACCWLPMSYASIWSKRVNKYGAILSMSLGFAGCFGVKLFTTLKGGGGPVYLDSAFLGMGLSVLGLMIGSAVTKVTPAEDDYRKMLHVRPQTERDMKELSSNIKYAQVSIVLGIAITVILLVFWALPYTRAVAR